MYSDAFIDLLGKNVARIRFEICFDEFLRLVFRFEI